jgi:diaminopimelate epimerase
MGGLTAQLYAGVDNRFLLFEGLEGVDRAALARALCVQPLFHGERADGVLFVEQAPGADARMVIFNADGSRPEACGNGLRCVGWHLARTRGLEHALVETDAGPRAVRIVERAEGHAVLLAEMGAAQRLGVVADLPQDLEVLSAEGYDLGNPHCILRVDDERDAEVERIGRVLQSHALYPRGVNVGFLAQRAGRWYLRVWERGVGETEACGTNACAAAEFLFESDGEPRHTLHLPGGELLVERLESGALTLLGTARHAGEVEVEERAAWAS